MTAGKYLQLFRMKARLVQSEIAREMGISQQAYARYETRKVFKDENISRVEEAIERLKANKKCQGIPDLSTK